MADRLDNIEAQLALLTTMVNDLAQRVTAADGGPVEVRRGGLVLDEEELEVSAMLGQRAWGEMNRQHRL